MKKNYIDNYLKKYSTVLKNYNLRDFLKIAQLIKNVKKNKKKVIIVGNGGSAAMASHVCVDLTKMCKIRSINFNEAFNEGICLLKLQAEREMQRRINANKKQ